VRCFTCGQGAGSSFSNAIASLSRAAAKSAKAKIRSIGALQTHENWPARAATCERCPLRVIHNGTSHCGTPYLNKPFRTPTDGCGCPTIAKAKDPSEHCPLTVTHTPATKLAGQCTCKWCAAAA